MKLLAEENLMHDIYIDESTITGSCAVTVVNVDRTCIAILDACEKYPQSHLESKLNPTSLAETVVFYSTAFFIQSNFSALIAMARFANQNNKLFAFNFAAEYIYKQSRPQLLEIIAYSDFIFCNKYEAIACGQDMKSDLGLT